RLEQQRAAHHLLQLGRDYVRRIKTHWPRLLAPALGLQPLAGQAAIKQRAYREHIGALVDALAPIDLGCGVTVVENRLALKLRVIANVVEPQEFHPSAGAVGERLRAHIVKSKPAPVEERNRLAGLNRYCDRLTLAHLEPATALGQRSELLVRVAQVNSAAIGQAVARAREGRMGAGS